MTHEEDDTVDTVADVGVREPGLDEIEQVVTTVVAEIAELPEAELWQKRDAHLFEDLGIDSLLALEIVASLERRYRIQVPEERILEVTSLMQAVSLVKELVGGDGR
jgi:acyl carrier protein